MNKCKADDTVCRATPYIAALMAIGLVINVILGVIMALRFNRNKKLVIGCLLLGILIPAILFS